MEIFRIILTFSALDVSKPDLPNHTPSKSCQDIWMKMETLKQNPALILVGDNEI